MDNRKGINQLRTDIHLDDGRTMSYLGLDRWEALERFEQDLASIYPASLRPTLDQVRAVITGSMGG